MNIGLFISECEGEVSRTIDLNVLAAHYNKDMPVRIFNNLNSSSSLKEICREVTDKKIDSIVLAGESPIFYRKTRNGDLLLQMLYQAGINPNRIAIANLKEQVALPHRSVPAEATKKAKVIIDVAIEKVKLSRDVDMIEVSPKKAVTIIGTTPEGIFTAHKLLERGFHIDFIDRETLRDLKTFKGDMMPTLAFVKNHPNASFHVSKIKDLYGYAGHFRIILENTKKLHTGGIVVAIGDDRGFTEELYPFIRIERDGKGLFKTLSSDTAVTETTRQGIFMISHMTALNSVVAFADSAAMSLDSLLSKNMIKHELYVSEVDQNVCGGCGTCIKTCMFHAVEFDAVKKITSTNIKRCVGCGNCVSACPTGARDQVSANTKYYLSAIKKLSAYEPSDGIKLLYFACEGCGYSSLDHAGTIGLQYPASLMPLAVGCAGRLDTQFILEAFREGFDGVVICKCKEDHCLNIVGNIDLDRRANLFRSVLSSRGISPDRLRIFGVSDCDGGACVSGTVEFFNYLQNLGRHNGEN